MFRNTGTDPLKKQLDLSDRITSQGRFVRLSVKYIDDEKIVRIPLTKCSGSVRVVLLFDTLAAWEQKWGMDFHPQKCNVLRVSRAKSPMTFSYRLKGIVLAEEVTSKYLGVDLQNNLSWNQHVSRVTKKANSMLRFLRLNVRKASKETKAQAYMSMAKSNIDYCSTVWNPHQRDQKYQVEMVQRRAAPFLTNRNTSRVTDMLDYLGREKHESRRTKLQLTVFYKIVHDLIAIPHSRYLTSASKKTRAAHSFKFQQYPTSTDCFKFSFFPRTIPVWNRLPAAAAEAPSLVSFKELGSLTF